jgi:hypothetical protein
MLIMKTCTDSSYETVEYVRPLLARAIETVLAGDGAERYRANAKALAIKFRSSEGRCWSGRDGRERGSFERHKQFERKAKLGCDTKKWTTR